MKNIISSNRWSLATVLAATLALCLTISSGLAQGADENVAQHFPYVIQQELGAAEFAADDQITITSVRGDRQHLELGGSYLVEGYYTLASADSAELSLFCTSRGPSGPTPIQEAQRAKINKGSGSFQLQETLREDGWLHVSFYVHGHSHGGIYFGEKGMENSVLRKKGWSDFTPERSVAATGGESDPENESNRALMAYLGNPVPPPADMDARYSKENLTKAFTAMSQRAGWVVTKLAVDDSEFPFLVYGILAGKHTLEVSQFDEAGGYPYSGSVRGSTGDGSTYFAVNMVPHNQIPGAVSQTCHRRLTVRMQMLADKAQMAE